MADREEEEVEGDPVPEFEKFSICPNLPPKKIDEIYEDFELLVELNK